MIRYIRLIFIALVLLSASADAQENCTLRKDSEGVKVYLCDNPPNNFKTIIVELNVPATLSQYAALVLDIENYINWQYKVKNHQLLQSISNTELYYYSQVSTPWPTSDRDYIFHLKLNQDENTKTLTMSLEAKPEFIATKEDIIRIPFAESMLTVSPIDKSNVKVRYKLDIDPGGEVPAWVVNIFAANAPWHTYVNFRNRIKEQGENRKEAPFISNY